MSERVACLTALLRKSHCNVLKTFPPGFIATVSAQASEENAQTFEKKVILRNHGIEHGA